MAKKPINIASTHPVITIDSSPKWRGSKDIVTAPERFMLDRDDSGQWYCFPAKLEATFEAWQASFYEHVGYEGPNFETYRISGNPNRITFLDPQDR